MTIYDQAIQLLSSRDQRLDSMSPLLLIGMAEIHRLKGDHETMTMYLESFFGRQGGEANVESLERWANDKTKPMIEYGYFRRLAGKV